MCLGNKDFMREYRRLRKHRLGHGPPIDRMIDEATGKIEAEANELFCFVRDCVWFPVVSGMTFWQDEWRVRQIELSLKDMRWQIKKRKMELMLPKEK